MMGSISRVGSAQFHNGNCADTTPPADRTTQCDQQRVRPSKNEQQPLNDAIEILTDHNATRAAMIRRFLGVGRAGLPVETDQPDAADHVETPHEGVLAAVRRIVRELVEAMLKGEYEQNAQLPRREMLRLVLAEDPAAEVPMGNEIFLSAGARIAAFCAGLIKKDTTKALQSHRLTTDLNVRM